MGTEVLFISCHGNSRENEISGGVDSGAKTVRPHSVLFSLRLSAYSQLGIGVGSHDRRVIRDPTYLSMYDDICWRIRSREDLPLN